MDGQTNDKNPAGTRWWNTSIYGPEKEIYPEEDHQVAACPLTLLYRELGNRVNSQLNGEVETLTWMGKTFNFSAVSEKQLLHHIGAKLD